MIDAKRLLSELQAQQRALEGDLRQQVAKVSGLREALEEDYKAARSANRTSDTFNAWCENEITQAAVAWVLACVFVRFCEDNALLPQPLLAGPGDRNRQARDTARDYFQQHPTNSDRHWLLHTFDQMAQYPAVSGLYRKDHNPLYRLPVSADAASALLSFWQSVDPDTGALIRDFTDPTLDTRFLGDLYQDLSESARKRFALLQTPIFVEEFILDRTLDPAIETFGLEQVRMIDPTCGSGHFLLGAFARINARWDKQGLEPRERVKRTLGAVYGVDLNPFAVAIARFRLLVAALQATGIGKLKEAPGWQFNVTTGDALLHGRRFGELDLGSDDLDARFAHCFFAEDRAEIDRILGQQYHAVVGNPPYITVKDASLNALYRARYSTCHMKYSLGVPFTERFFQLAVSNGNQPAGYIGLITTNSFMKREFGKKLIEDYLPRQDLTHVIDTKGAYIPGHGTPTVILFARHRRPVSGTIRGVMGIRGEPSTPEDPAQGCVWTSIVRMLDRPGSQNEFVSVADTPRETLAAHPWSLSGGGVPEVLEAINTAAAQVLSEVVTEIGFGAVLGEDDAFMLSHARADSRRTVGVAIRPIVEGDIVRDWSLEPETAVVFPYDESVTLVAETLLNHRYWFLRTRLWARNDFGGQTYKEAGRRYWAYHQIPVDRNRMPLSITFAFVATHNHFVLDRGGKVFNRSAPVIKLPADADEATHLGLLGLLNSSTACFWMKQVFHNKGSTVDGKGARQTTVEFENFYEFTGTGMQRFPLPDSRPLALAAHLDQLARARVVALPAAVLKENTPTRATLDDARLRAESLLAQMIATQEELDWWCYRAYDLIDEGLCYAGTPPELSLGERAFEISMARHMEAGELETTWFQRHGSTPRSELPAHWPADYRTLVEKRFALIESHPWIGLLEKPEYKRRWNQLGWEELEQAALHAWLLDRLETPAYWPAGVLRSVDDIATTAERDADFMAVAALYLGQQGFDLRSLLLQLLNDESVPALKVLRYKESGLRKRVDWEQTWDLQRKEDAIDAAVAKAHPRQAGETDPEWETRLKPERDQRKRKEVGDIPAPPKYAAADFQSNTIKRLRGDLDVPKERCFTIPKNDAPGEWLYGWAGWNPVQRVQAMVGSFETCARQGWSGAQLVPHLAAIHEELPWVLQWHNEVDPEFGLRLGDYFREKLAQDLHANRLTTEDLANWRPEAAGRGRRRRASA